MQSSNAMSICWPSPVAFPLCQGRLHRDNTIEPGENICEGNADLCGSRSGSPVRSMMPLMPWTM